MKNFKSLVLICLTVILLAACKKGKIEVNETKVFVQAVEPSHINTNPELGGWSVRLKPNGTAEIAPGGDIVFSGRYTINGAYLKIKTEYQTFDFDILSETEIKERRYGVLLKLKAN